MSKEITLAKAGLSNCEELYQLQTISFRPLLEKYQDYDSNPGAETKDRTLQRLKDPFTDYYFICLSGKHIGAVRISHFETLCRLKQLFILPEFQGHGYAQQAILLAEALYPEIQRWELDTISQEAKLCHLYEKMGYTKTGRMEKIKDGMDLVYYARHTKRAGSGCRQS